MKKIWKKAFWMIVIMFIFMGITTFIAKMLGVNTNEMIVYMLAADYCLRLYDNIAEN